jgi:hypothetical protein
LSILLVWEFFPSVRQRTLQWIAVGWKKYSLPCEFLSRREPAWDRSGAHLHVEAVLLKEELVPGVGVEPTRPVKGKGF